MKKDETKAAMKECETFEVWLDRYFRGEDAKEYKKLFKAAHGKKITRSRPANRGENVPRLRPRDEDNLPNSQPRPDPSDGEKSAVKE